MANDLYSHDNTPNPNHRYGSLTSYYTSSRSLLTEPYVPPSLITSPSSAYLPSKLPDRYFPAERDVTAPSAAYWSISAPSAADLIASKRSSEAFYEKSVLGSHNIIGHSEAWLSSLNLMAKRPKHESTGNLSVYPQRPGEKHCSHYMLTRTCKFGDACKFDHPIWVPEVGIPNWKEVPQSSDHSLSFPERPGEPDCPYFLKTSDCKFGHNCKFNHPKDKVVSSVTSENTDASVLPERPTETSCPYYLKTGKCKFGASCKFHHPKDIHVPLIGSGEQYVSPKFDVTIKDVNPAQLPVAAPALHYNSNGLPIRLGEVVCPYYMKTGSCKYGAACCYSHPNKNTAMDLSVLTSPAISLNHGLVNPTASILRSLDARLAPTMFGLGPVIYPQRPGESECDHYMKTGECKFVERCKFHHPIDRSNPNSVKLTLAGLPRREGSEHCAFYMKTGTCKYGPQCKYDHPPPCEVIGLAAAQETATSAGSVGKDDNKGETTKEGHL